MGEERASLVGEPQGDAACGRRARGRPALRVGSCRNERRAGPALGHVRRLSGWGEDLDGLAALHDRRPEIVVFEPRGTGTESGCREPAPDASTTSAHSTTESGGRAAHAVAAKPRLRLRIRHLWLVPGLAIALFGSAEAARTGAGIVPLLLFGIAPHLAFLAGIGQRRLAGHMAPRAATVFNALHRPLVPVAILALNLVGLLSPFVYVGSLSWLSHIVTGRAIGDGHRQVADPLADRDIGRRATLIQGRPGSEESSIA